MIRISNSKAGLSPRFIGAAATGLVAVSLLGAAPISAQDDADEAQTELTKGEEKLARLLEGRVAGEPQDCIRDHRTTNITTIDETAYVYGRGRTIYVQRTRAPERIDRDDILVVRRFASTQLCRLDFVTTIDRFAGFFTGGVQFDQFVPYTRVEDKDG